jgi:hypothetical protein
MMDRFPVPASAGTLESICVTPAGHDGAPINENGASMPSTSTVTGATGFGTCPAAEAEPVKGCGASTLSKELST